jgi:transcriptional regulator with XRE-family HTH domain
MRRKLAELRKRRGMTQEQVATRMGVSVPGLPDRRRRRLHPGRAEPLHHRASRNLRLIAGFGDEQLKIA